MKTSLASEIFVEADEVKATLAEEKTSNAHAVIQRQKIQDLYQRLLLMDLEFALDKKVETDLWNVAFKNVIDSYQVKVKEKNAQKRAENQASLALFLEAASGFYHQLMQDVCCAFKLDVPFRRKSSRFGILSEPSPVAFQMKTPKKSSCFYLLQHILVHLGDIARYKKDMKQADIFYTHAAELIPTNGQPFNQLALLDMHQGNKLATVYHYVRSIAVKHPFPAAETNLHKFYERISKEVPSSRQKTSEENFIKTFLTFASLLHLRENLPKAKECFSTLTTMICTNGILSKLPLSSLLHVACIGVFTLHRARELPQSGGVDGSPRSTSNNNNGDKDDEDEEEEEEEDDLVGDELEVYEVTLSFLVTVASDLILEAIAMKSIQITQKNLQVIKLVLAYVSQSKRILQGSWVKEKSQFWPHLATLMNSLQNQTQVFQLNATQITQIKPHPLADETRLQGFLPLAKYLTKFDLSAWRKSQTQSDGSQACPHESEVVRSVHLLELGRRIAESLRNLRLLSLEETKSGKMNFHSGIQVTDDHRFSDRIPSSSASSTPSTATSSSSSSAFAPTEFRPQQSAPVRNPNLGPRFNKINRQNVALQSFMSNLSAESPPTEAETRRQPSPPSAVAASTPTVNIPVNSASSASSSSSTARHTGYIPPPRMANKQAQQQAQQQSLYDPNKASSPGLPPGTVPEDTRGKKNNQLFQVKKDDAKPNAATEDFPALQSTTRTSKVVTTGSSFFSSSSSATSSSSSIPTASLTSSLTATVNKNANYSLFSQNLPSWTPPVPDSDANLSNAMDLQRQHQLQQQQQQQRSYPPQPPPTNSDDSSSAFSHSLDRFHPHPQQFQQHQYLQQQQQMQQHPRQAYPQPPFAPHAFSGPMNRPHAGFPYQPGPPRPMGGGGAPLVGGGPRPTGAPRFGDIRPRGVPDDSNIFTSRSSLVNNPSSSSNNSIIRSGDSPNNSNNNDNVNNDNGGDGLLGPPPLLRSSSAFGVSGGVFEDSRWKFQPGNGGGGSGGGGGGGGNLESPLAPSAASNPRGIPSFSTANTSTGNLAQYANSGLGGGYTMPGGGQKGDLPFYLRQQQRQQQQQQPSSFHNVSQEDTPILGIGNSQESSPRDHFSSNQLQQHPSQAHFQQQHDLKQKLDQERLQQERLRQERLLQERRQQERLLHERQQQMMMANQMAMQAGANQQPRPGEGYGTMFSNWGPTPGFGGPDSSMGGEGGGGGVGTGAGGGLGGIGAGAGGGGGGGGTGGGSALEKLIQEQRRRNQESES